MDANHKNSPPILWRIGWRYLLRRPWQTLFMIIGVMIGVAVMVAIDLANASASQAFNLSTEAVVGKATHQILGGPQGIPEEVYVNLRRSGLTQQAAPVISIYVTSPQLGGQPFQLLGVDPFAEAPFRNYLSFTSGPPVEGLTNFFGESGALLISQETATQFQLGVRDPIILEIGGNQVEGSVSGLLRTSDELSRRALEGVILADIATVQEFTGRLGVIDRIDLIAFPDDTELLASIEALLPEGIRITPVAARTGTVAELTAAFSVNLTALSLLALVVGMFLIYNTMTFSVVQRRPLFGTMRSSRCHPPRNIFACHCGSFGNRSCQHNPRGNYGDRPGAGRPGISDPHNQRFILRRYGPERRHSNLQPGERNGDWSGRDSGQCGRTGP